MFDSRLFRFISDEMRMKTDGQPCVVRGLMRNGGEASIQELARLYCRETGHNYGDRQATQRVRAALDVLTRRGHVSVSNGAARLAEYDSIPDSERIQIDRICTRRVMDWRESH